MNTEEARRALEQIQAEADRDNLRYTPLNGPKDSMTKDQLIQQGQDNIAFCADIQAALGTVWSLAANGLLALDNDPPIPPPQPPPTPTTLAGFAISYAGHDPARDIYLGYDLNQVEWGPHHGIDLLAPAPGKVEAYSFPTPLGALSNSELSSVGGSAQQNWLRLFAGGPPCCPPPQVTEGFGGHLHVTGQAMSIAVYWPDTPINGLKALWFGHVRPDIAVGRVDTRGRICTSWDSGIRFENQGTQARAAHVHACASATGTLSPNGDVDGLRACAAMGWQIEWRGAVGPGPNDYMTGQWLAGKRRAVWSGHPVPPVPE